MPGFVSQYRWDYVNVVVFKHLRWLEGRTQPGRLCSPWGAKGDFRASLSTASGVRGQGQRQAAAARGRGESRNRFSFIGREGALGAGWG